MSSVEVTTAHSTAPKESVDSQRRLTSDILARPAGWTLCLTLLLAIAVWRIVSTYHVFNHTIDEPSHIACGIEWWEKGVYQIETKHAPLARISVALGPYLAGVHAIDAKTWRDTYPILSADGHYWRNLTLGRIGVLPYFIIATLVVFFWTKRLFGAPTALVAAAVFTLLPTMLAHSAVATTDVPLAAMFCWALYAFTLWLAEPNWRTAALFGVTSGLSLSTKFSTLVFLPGCAAAILVLYAAAGRRNWRALFRSLTVVVLCAFFVTWAVYRFSHAPLNQVTKIPDRAAAKVFGKSSRMTAAVQQVTSKIPVPAPELFDGIRTLRNQNSEGYRGFLFGRIKMGGWWYFFLAAIALKTPLAVLLLAGGAAVAVVRRHRQNLADWEVMAPVAAAVMVMIVTMPSRINIGVRHVLPMYIFLSILAAAGLAMLWARRDHRVVSRAAAVLLCAWLVISSARSHPDYLAYFNEFGGRDTSRLLVVSDFDWGQDLARLSNYLREQQVKHVTIVYDGFFVPDSLGLPETELITTQCDAKPSGWVVMEVRRARLHPDCYPWLAQQHRITTVGKTMWVYNMKP